MPEARILTIDIETAPALADVWSLWKENVPLQRLREATRVLSVAAKWHGDKRVMFASEFHNGPDDMLQLAWDWLSEADIVVHWNGARFDVPHLQREFLLADLPPPAPFAQVDLMVAVKKQFRFMSNKLAHVSTELGLEGKHEVDYSIWQGCMIGDPKAWAKMKRYNVQDVRLTEQVYDRLRPWISTHPHMGLYAAKQFSCSNCGSTNVERRGYAYTALGRYQRFVCNDCGRYSRGASRDLGADIRGTA